MIIIDDDGVMHKVVPIEVLDKIRDEIKDRPYLMMSTSKEYERGVNAMLYQALSIIDKYREGNK